MTQKLSKKFNESRSLMVVVFIVFFFFFIFLELYFLLFNQSFKLKQKTS